MTMLSLHLGKAVSRGRAEASAPKSRAEILVRLLRKRAVAHNVGAEELEDLLRAQIRWALPLHDTQEAA
jgi:hypothetical protein